MPKPHQAQLRICHELIGAGELRMSDTTGHCSLSAFAWCTDCDYYVCEIHLMSRHMGHNVQLRSLSQTSRDANKKHDRRSGNSRRKEQP